MAQGTIVQVPNSERACDSRSRTVSLNVTWAATTYTATTISPQKLGITSVSQIEMAECMDVTSTLSTYIPVWDYANGVLRLMIITASVLAEYSGSLSSAVTIRVKFTFFP